MLAFLQAQPFSLGTSEENFYEIPSIQALIRTDTHRVLLLAHQPSFLLIAAFVLLIMIQAFSAAAQVDRSLASCSFQMHPDSSSTALISTFLHFASVVDRTRLSHLQAQKFKLMIACNSRKPNTTSKNAFARLLDHWN